MQLKQKFNTLLFSIVIIIMTGRIKAQDPVFSQYYNSPTQINPAFAGNTISPQFYLNYRNQWPEFDTYTTYAVSYDQGFNTMNSGLGLFILADDAGAGTIRNTQINAMYSYKLTIDRSTTIKFGLEAGYVQSRLNWNKLVFFDQLDPQFGAIGPDGVPFPSNETPPLNGNLNHGYLDFGAGVLYYSPKFYGGLSFKHINQPDYSFFGDERNVNANLPLRTTIILGYQKTLLRANNAHYGNYLSPSMIFVRQGDFYQLNTGVVYSMNQLLFGGAYRLSGRTGDAVITMLGWRYENIKFSYSFDFTLSDIGINSGGSHEIGISLNLDAFYDKPSRYNDCFAIFR